MNARYTVLLKTLMEQPETREKLDRALSTYPIYVPTIENEEIRALIPTREELNAKLLNFYKYREIGLETPARFFEELEISLCEIMPYYNQMMKTVEIMNDLPSPFDNVDVIETYEEERSNTSTGKGNTQITTNDTSNNTTTATDKTTTDTTMNDNSKSVKSSTPQGELSIPASGIDGVSYADEVSWNANASTSKATSDGTNTATSETKTNGSSTTKGDTETTEKGLLKHTYTKKGNQGVNTYAHDMLEFRETILNIVQMIIHDERIEELFMLVY